MNIVWSKTAEKNYLNVLKYLVKEWTHNEIIQLDGKVQHILKSIAGFKAICPPSKKLNIHKCVVDGNNSLVYKVKNKTLFVVDFIPHKRKVSRY
jgi:hypothetical protein